MHRKVFKYEMQIFKSSTPNLFIEIEKRVSKMIYSKSFEMDGKNAL